MNLVEEIYEEQALNSNLVSNANILVRVYDPAWSGYNNSLTTVDSPSTTDINGNFNFPATTPVARGIEGSSNGHIYDYAGIFFVINASRSNAKDLGLKEEIK